MKKAPRLILRSNGYYCIYFSRRKILSLKTKDSRLAKELFKKEIARLREGKIHQLDKVKRITLSEFKEEYLEKRTTELELQEIVEGTIENDRRALSQFIEVIGDIPLRLVNRTKIDEFKKKRLADAKDLQKRMNTINVLLRSLRAAFNWAALDDPENGKIAYIEQNPFSKKKNEKKGLLFHLGDRLPRFLETAEIDILKNVVKKHIEHIEKDIESLKTSIASAELNGIKVTPADKWKLKQLQNRLEIEKDTLNLVDFDLYSGLRRGELCRLKWSDIKLSINVIHVVKTKNRKERNVPIPPKLREIILKKIGIKDIGFVFPRWRSNDTISRLFTELAKEAGICKTLNSIRHAYGSYSVMSGIDLITVQENMGHADLKTTRIYAKVSDLHKQKEIKKLKFGIEDK